MFDQMEITSHTNKRRGRSVSGGDDIHKGSPLLWTAQTEGVLSEESPYVMVLMPTFNQAPFIRRALESLLSQTLTNWKLAIIDDGSLDNTRALVQTYLADPRISYQRLDPNQGLGVALNFGLALAKAPLIAYLPSDDVYYRDHLASLMDILMSNDKAALAYSGVQHEFRVPGMGVLENKSSPGQIEGHPLQLVQVMHRFTGERWMERGELVTDDLERMFWSKLRQWGSFVGTNRISCQWVDHPHQRHKVIQEPAGGINPYRVRYNVQQPLRFHASTSSLIDEVEHFRRFREREDTPFAADGLKILLVGELAFNAERVLALEERGHKLYGVWTPDTHWFNTVGPLPFGHVEDLPRTGWREAVLKLKPDIIYALLNWITVPFAHHVLTNNPGIPFVWHFKEGPFDCISNGTWEQLIDLYTLSDGQIFCNAETRDWFNTAVPGIADEKRSLVLDGDLPKKDWFTADRSPLLSEADGKIHTVIPGGPKGLHPAMAARMAQQDIHLHLYGEFHQGYYRRVVEEALRVADRHLHLHSQVNQEDWVSELSKYDAGWLHIHKSENEGDLQRASWDDLNYPARMPTLAAAGLPFIQYDNSGAVVAVQSLARELDIGMYFKDIEQLTGQLLNKAIMTKLRNNMWLQREKFTFDYHADRLIEFFRQVIRMRHS
jgi:hypothetical protein